MSDYKVEKRRNENVWRVRQEFGEESKRFLNLNDAIDYADKMTIEKRAKDAKERIEHAKWETVYIPGIAEGLR